MKCNPLYKIGFGESPLFNQMWQLKPYSRYPVSTRFARTATPIFTWKEIFCVLWRITRMASIPPGQPKKNESDIRTFSGIRLTPFHAFILSMVKKTNVMADIERYISVKSLMLRQFISPS